MANPLTSFYDLMTPVHPHATPATPATPRNYRLVNFPLQPHQQRVVTERNELATKLGLLDDFITSNPIFATLPAHEHHDLSEQRGIMQSLLTVLDRRIDSWKPKPSTPQIAPHLLMQMPRWQCHKIVRAVNIHEVTLHDPTGISPAGDTSFINHPDFAGGFVFPELPPFYQVPGKHQQTIPIDAAFIRKHKPQKGGYLVVYEDGYMSYSPAAPFESGYSLIEE